MTFKIDTSDIDRFAANLHEKFPRDARAATAAALNRTAVVAKGLARRNMRQRFTLRNKWVLGSVRSTKTPPTRPIGDQFTMVGSLSPIMALQERGGALPRSKKGRRITTARGSREGATAYPRRRVATGKYRPNKINFRASRGVKGSPGRRAKVAVEMARRAGQKFIYLRLRADRAGIFEVQKRSIRMVHRIMRRRLSVKARPWLEPAAVEARGVAPKTFLREMRRRFT